MAGPGWFSKLLAIVFVLGGVTSAGTLNAQVPRSSPSAPASPIAAPPPTPTPTRETAPVGATSPQTPQIPAKEKEISISKSEVKEIKDHPSTLVGLVDALAWPVVVIFVLIALLRSSWISRAIGFLPQAVRAIKVSVAGVEMEINQQAAEEVRSFLVAPIEDLRKKADTEYKKMADAQRVYELLQSAIEVGCTSVLERKQIQRPALIRGTVHVPDIVFNEYLYQLVNYYPGSRANGPAGRRFSQRFGIIGRSWRLGESMARPTAPGTSAEDIRDLVEQWGMSREEAAGQSRTHPACICVILRSPEDNNLPVGLLYLDTTQDQGFGSDDAMAVEVARTMETEEVVQRLALAVGRTIMLLRLAGPKLDIERGA